MFEYFRQVRQSISETINGPAAVLLVPVGMAIVYRGVKALGERSQNALEEYTAAVEQAKNADRAAT